MTRRTPRSSDRVQVVTATVGDGDHPELLEAESVTLEASTDEVVLTLENGREYHFDAREIRAAVGSLDRAA